MYLPPPIRRPMHSQQDLPQSGEFVPRWYCVRSKPKQEILAVQTIRTLAGIRAFSTFFTYRKVVNNARRFTGEALFPNYLFVNCPYELTKQVHYSQGVSDILRRGGRGGEPIEVPDVIIRELLSIAPYPDCRINLADPEFRVGQNVRVIAGVFQNLEAKIVRVASAKRRVEILITLLGQENVVPLDMEAIAQVAANPRERVLTAINGR
jgi:transcription antitermination factor NusG